MSAVVLLLWVAVVATATANGGELCMKTSTYNTSLWDTFGIAVDDGPGACNDYMLDRFCKSVTFDPEPQPKSANPNDTYSPDPGAVPVGYIAPFTGLDSVCETTSHMGMLCAIDQLERARKVGEVPFSLSPVFADSLGLETGGISASWCLHQLNVPVILGPILSGPATGAATVGKILRIPLLGATASSESLANNDTKTGFPTYSRIVPSDELEAKALVLVAKRFRWNKVIVVNMMNCEYSTGIVSTFTSLAKASIDITDSLSFTRDARDPDDAGNEYKSLVRSIKDNTSNTRVVLLIGYVVDVRQILKYAREEGIMDEGWAWMGTDSWVSEINAEGCGNQETGSGSDFAQGVIGVVPHVDRTSQAYENLQQCFQESTNEEPSSSSATPATQVLSWMRSHPNWRAAFMYDSVWVLHRALSLYWDDLSNNDTDVKFPSDAIIGALATVQGKTELLKYVRKVKYNGASGTVRLDDKGERIGGMYSIMNVQFNDTVEIGRVTLHTEEHRTRFNAQLDADEVVFYNGTTVLFPGNSTKVPLASAVVCNVDGLDESEKAIGDLSCFLGMMLAFSFAVFNVLYRNNKIVRVSSWRINLVTIFGCFLIYMALNSFTLEANKDLYRCDNIGETADVTFENFNETFIDTQSKMAPGGDKDKQLVQGNIYAQPNHVSGVCQTGSQECLEEAGAIICSSRTWLFGLGFCLTFGSLFAKTYRISKLFSGQPIKRTIGDPQVLMYIAVMVVPMVIFLATWEILYPHKAVFFVTKGVTTFEGTVYNVRESCAGGEFHQTFMLIFVFYCFAMLMVGTFLAWSVKDVWIKEVNDSSEVAICIYTILVVGGLGYAVSIILVDKTKSYLASTFSVWICTTLVLCILFGPKINEVWKHRGEEEITLGTTPTRVGIHEAEKLMESDEPKEDPKLTFFQRLSLKRRKPTYEDDNPMYSSGETRTDNQITPEVVSSSGLVGSGGRSDSYRRAASGETDEEADPLLDIAPSSHASIHSFHFQDDQQQEEDAKDK